MSSYELDDTQTRRTICLRTDLFDKAMNRLEQLDYSNFSEYIRWLIISDMRYNLLDRQNLAKRELEITEKPTFEAQPFWKRK